MNVKDNIWACYCNR